MAVKPLMALTFCITFIDFVIFFFQSLKKPRGERNYWKNDVDWKKALAMQF